MKYFYICCLIGFTSALPKAQNPYNQEISYEPPKYEVRILYVKKENWSYLRFQI